ncbi:Tat pathway signal protein [Microbacterium album]|uniref:Tat pathway signal protein n=2 Tax=Microbacterium album TaxID=2053191 RepID=A0A917IH34_9MICO|nr:Tat pathway signal protein [Microbacterium album]
MLRIGAWGAGSVAVAAAGALTWRSVDGGVFAAGTGPAYEPWSLPAPSGPRDLVHAAILAANAHNTQPWIFRVEPDRIDVFADGTRTIGTIDPLLREQQISLGCALENLLTVAPLAGLRATPTLLPDPSDPGHVARVDLAPTARTASPLADAIPSRHTDRAAYLAERPVSDAALKRYRDAAEGAGVSLLWLADDDERRAFGDLTVRATEAIIADPDQAADDHRWYRSEWRDIQRLRDGVTIDASGQPAFIRTVAKIFPTTREQNHDGWLRGTRDTQVPTAAAFGALVVPDGHDPAARLAAGRAYQRLHLMATADGIAMQPLCQIPERVDREESAGLDPHFTRELADLVPAGHAIMTFRIGHPTVAAPPSPRRAVEDVLADAQSRSGEPDTAY